MPVTNLRQPVRTGSGTCEASIHVLAPDIANVIAAGEVVERPASVVRELVDNALDAEATSIEVSLVDAGKTLIEVRDDGIGMSEQDAQMALERHATSKVRTLEDLHTIHSLGFRGEALPSIAAAAEVSITTARADDAVGTRVRSEERGTQVSVQKVGVTRGTTVRVEHLFAALPARQKFLKGDRTELGHIQDLVTRQALANPQCRFVLRHGKRNLLQCNPQAELRNRMAELFGADRIEQCVPLEADGAARVYGYCGLPALAKPGASQLYLFVNGRAVRDRVLTHAVLEGYRTYIARGDQPFVVLFLDIDPEEVDVNVHPAKAEVRLANSGAIHSLLKHAVRKCLEQANTLQPPASPETYTATSSAYTARASVQPYHSGPQAVRPSALQVQETMRLYEPLPEVQQDAFAQEGSESAVATTWRPMGQLASTYLLYEGPDGALCVVDQHAAHERLGYERFKQEWLHGGVERQVLLQPDVLSFDSATAEVLIESTEALASLGFVVADFGDASIAIHEVPALLQDADFQTLLAAVAEDLRQSQGLASLESHIDHILMTMACHRMVRAGDVLRDEEATALLAQMEAGESMDRCPHGRPTWVRIPKSDIEKWFKRS